MSHLSSRYYFTSGSDKKNLDTRHRVLNMDTEYSMLNPPKTRFDAFKLKSAHSMDPKSHQPFYFCFYIFTNFIETATMRLWMGCYSVIQRMILSSYSSIIQRHLLVNRCFCRSISYSPVDNNKRRDACVFGSDVRPSVGPSVRPSGRVLSVRSTIARESLHLAEGFQ